MLFISIIERGRRLLGTEPVFRVDLRLITWKLFEIEVTTQIQKKTMYKKAHFQSNLQYESFPNICTFAICILL